MTAVVPRLDLSHLTVAEPANPEVSATQQKINSIADVIRLKLENSLSCVTLKETGVTAESSNLYKDVPFHTALFTINPSMAREKLMITFIESAPVLIARITHFTLLYFVTNKDNPTEWHSSYIRWERDMQWKWRVGEEGSLATAPFQGVSNEDAIPKLLNEEKVDLVMCPKGDFIETHKIRPVKLMKHKVKSKPKV